MIQLCRKTLLVLAGLFLAVITYAQTVSGTVTGDDGEALIGVTVMKKNTTVGTVTDADGSFELAANPGDVLVLSYVGYAT